MAQKRALLRFDGATTFVDIGAQPEHKIQKPLTVEALIYPERNGEYNGIVAKSHDDETGGYAIVLGGESGDGLFPARSIAYIVQLAAQEPIRAAKGNIIETGKWQHVAFVYDGVRKATLYINAEKQLELEVGGSPGQAIQYPVDAPLLLGRYRRKDLGGKPVDSFFQGLMAEVRIWSVARTPEELKAKSGSQLRGDEAGLVGYWPLDEGKGSVSIDKGERQRKGEIKNGAWVNVDDPIARPKVEVTPDSQGQQALLTVLRDNASKLMQHIPYAWNINYDVNTAGTAISDGGKDMFDVGNIFRTDIDTLVYSNNAVRRHAAVGPKGSYFSLQLRSIFILVADLDGAQSFGTTGKVGSEGNGGTVDGDVITAIAGGARYRGFIKRVYGATEPSVNHLFIVRDDAGDVQHSFSQSANSDEHTLTGLGSVSRVYCLMFGSRFDRAGVQVGREKFQAMMDTFLSLITAPSA